MAAGSPFYTSGTFWAGAGTVVGVVSLVVFVWVTLRVANPKRRLWYSMSSVTPLIVSRKDLSRELRILYGDDQLQFPHTANIQLVSRGRLDIRRSAFDGDEPLQVDVSAQIVEILKVATSPDRASPPVKYAGSKLFVGPCLIGCREKVVISVLVEGAPELRPLTQSLENVDIRPGDPELDRAHLGAFLTVAASAVIGGIVSLLVINTTLAQGSFEIASLRRSLATEALQQKALRAQIAQECRWRASKGLPKISVCESTADRQQQSGAKAGQFTVKFVGDETTSPLLPAKRS